MKRTKIAVLFGGCSPEHDISLGSARAVLQNLDPERYEILPVGITRKGDWFRYSGDYDRIADGGWEDDPALLTPVAVSPSRSEHALLELRPDGWRATQIDLALPILHGENGEDGTVQGLFALAAIPVAGCGVLASALCMDKHRAHLLARAAGVDVPKGVTVRRDEPLAVKTAALCYPLFVKPLRAGSSYGISRVESSAALPAAAGEAFRYGGEIIVEEAVEGVEVGCAVMGTHTLTVGRVDEIELKDGFLDYGEKYVSRSAVIHMPARVDAETERRITETAKVIYRALDCSGFARIDLFLTPTGGLVFNEVNTIPGITEHSRFPNMMKGAGLSLRETLDRLIALYVTP